MARREDRPPRIGYSSTPGVAPLLGRSETGLILFRRPEWIGTPGSPAIDLGHIKTERGYRNFMSRIRSSFAGWNPEWHDLPGLQAWAEEMRKRLPAPTPPSIPANAGPSAAREPYSEPEPLVYFVRIGDMIKIGYTTNLRLRVHGLSVTMNQVVATEPGTEEREAELHRRFAHLREFGEWFRAGPDLLKYIAGVQASGAKYPISCD